MLRGHIEYARVIRRGPCRTNSGSLVTFGLADKRRLHYDYCRTLHRLLIANTNGASTPVNTYNGYFCAYANRVFKKNTPLPINLSYIASSPCNLLDIILCDFIYPILILSHTDTQNAGVSTRNTARCSRRCSRPSKPCADDLPSSLTSRHHRCRPSSEVTFSSNRLKK